MGFVCSTQGGRKPLAETRSLQYPPEDLLKHAQCPANVELRPVIVQILPDGSFTYGEAAKYLGVYWETLLNWIKRGEGPPFSKRGGRFFFKKTEIDGWLDGRR